MTKHNRAKHNGKQPAKTVANVSHIGQPKIDVAGAALTRLAAETEAWRSSESVTSWGSAWKRPAPKMTLRPVDDQDPKVQKLLQMLTYRRPHRSQTEKEFIERFLGSLPDARVDGGGNIWVEIDVDREAQETILWSSHTDTVHRTQGRQPVTLGDGVVTLGDKSGSNCLGADCTAGVWLMCEMIEAKVPGLYVFHRGEECGGIGSSWLAKNYTNSLGDVRAAIAFDRRGEGSVITSQMGRCASNAFAASLGAILGADPALKLNYKADPTGTFTDTANYVDIIGECSNLSVGYYNEHSPDEMLNVGHLLALREALIKADWSKLVCERKAGAVDPDEKAWGWNSKWYGSFEEEIEEQLGKAGKTDTPTQAKLALPAPKEKNRDLAAYADEKLMALMRFCRNSPETAAEFLFKHHVGVRDLIEFEAEALEGMDD